MKISKENLQKILEEHSLWLKEEGGKRIEDVKIYLEWCDLSNTDLRGMHAYDSVFYGTIFSGANLEDANTRGGLFVYADFVNANMRNMKIVKGALHSCDLTDADLTGASLEYSDFYKSTLVGTNFTGANLEGVSFKESDLTCANFTNANLKNANFESANVRGIIIDGAKITVKTKEVGWCMHPTLKDKHRYGFRRNTIVDGVANLIGVSTIGEYFDDDGWVIPTREDIYYETAIGHIKRYGDYSVIDGRKTIDILDQKFREHKETSGLMANDMHERNVAEVIRMINDGEIK